MTALNQYQQAAVESNGERIVVSASPGSGKSATLIARIADRVACGVNPLDIVALTFSQAGAKVMADRLRELGIVIGFVGTRHSLCYRLLNRYGQRIGYRAGGVTLVNEEDADAILMDAAKGLGWKGSKKKLLAAECGASQLVWKEFRHRMRRCNSVTYDLVLEEALRVIRTLTPDDYQAHDILCDEAQDSSSLDWAIDEAIHAESRFAVGDEDQSIFSWRGAEPEEFVRVANLMGTQLHKLELNYRSGREICDAATTLIRHNRNRIDKAVVSASGAQCAITVNGYETSTDELRAVASMGALPSFQSIDPSEIAVIARTNAIAGQFRDALKANGIPVAEPRHRNSPPDWHAAIDVLNLWLDPRNDMLAEKVLKRISPEKVAACKERALRDGSWLSASLAGNLLRTQIHDVVMLLPRWNIGIETIDAISHRISLLPQPEPTLADLVHDMWNGSEGDESATEGVSCLTFHAAKGREFDTVFIVAAEDGVCPQRRKDSDEEDERRLFFVGMTRARHSLHISYAAKRQTQWATVEAGPSRFISEAGLL